MTDLEHALVLIGATGVLLAGSFLVLAAAATVHRGRRRHHAARARFRSVFAGRDTWSAASVRAVAIGTVGSPRWWLVQRRRHQLWRAVTAAEHAVGVAQRTGAPVGELPLLARQLRTATRGVDAQLRACARTGELTQYVRADASRIEAAAAELSRTATRAVNATTGTDTDTLASAIRLESSAVAAGIRAASSAAHLPVR